MTSVKTIRAALDKILSDIANKTPEDVARDQRLYECRLVAEFLRQLADRVESGATKKVCVTWAVGEDLRNEEVYCPPYPLNFVEMDLSVDTEEAEPMSDELVEVEYEELKGQSEKAFLLTIDGEECWVPKSQIDDVEELEEELKLPDYKRRGGTFEVPRWLAVKNGWVDDE